MNYSTKNRDSALPHPQKYAIIILVLFWLAEARSLTGKNQSTKRSAVGYNNTRRIQHEYQSS